MLHKENLSIFKELLGDGWYKHLEYAINDNRFINAGSIIAKERQHYTIYPETPDIIFRAFRETPFENVRIVILGQDPYHDGSCTGLAFSNSSNTVKPSPSLFNILTEVDKQIYNTERESKDYDLTRWAKQGILLLNKALTVRKGIPLSHMHLWDWFTTEVIRTISDTKTGIIFLLWGKNAQSCMKDINPFMHHILTCGHPVTPVYGKDKDTWSDNEHFKKVNEILTSINGEDAKINW